MRVSAQEVVRFVAANAGLSFDDLTGPSRQRSHAWPRFVAVWAVRQLCPHMSYPSIGRMLGGRDHSTIIDACNRAEMIVNLDDDMALLASKVMREFHGKSHSISVTVLQAKIEALKAEIICLEAMIDARLSVEAGNSPEVSV